MEITITVPDTIVFVSGDQTHEVGADKIPAASWSRLTAYGKRMFNDSVNGTVHAEKDKPAAERQSREDIALAWIDALCDGTLGTGRGGSARLSDLEKELRERVHSFLVESCGYKSGDARKLAGKGAERTFRDVVAVELGADAAQTDNGWTKLVEACEKTIAARKSGPSLDDLIS